MIKMNVVKNKIQMKMCHCTNYNNYNNVLDDISNNSENAHEKTSNKKS